MNKKLVIISTAIATGITAIVGAGLYATPYLTLDSLKKATSNRNANALAQEIDFPALRTSVKENVKAQIIKQMAGGNTPVKGSNAAAVDKIVNPMVDKLVTPEGLGELMLDKIPGATIDLSNLEKNIAESEVKMGYESFDRFVVRITDKVDRTKDVSLILKRDGLAWKLSGIDISKV
jgi:Protein of unknown function (DUF2939)